MVWTWTLATTLIVLSLVAFKLSRLHEFIRLYICIFQQVCSTSTSFFMKCYSWKVAVWFQGHWLGVIDRAVSNFCLTQLYCSEQGLTQTVLKAESKTRSRGICTELWSAVWSGVLWYLQVMVAKYANIVVLCIFRSDYILQATVVFLLINLKIWLKMALIVLS